MKYAQIGMLSAVLLHFTACATVNNNVQAQVDIRNQLVAEYIRIGDLDAAKRSLDYIFKLDVNNPKALMMMGVLLQQEGGQDNLQKAQHYFQQAILLDADNPQIRSNYGIYLSQMGQYESAIEQLQKAAHHLGYEQRFIAWQNLGQIYWHLQQYEQAEHSFRQAIRVNSAAIQAKLNLAELYYEQQRYPEANELFQSSIATERKLSAQALWLGVRLARVNQDYSQMQLYIKRLQQNYAQSAEYKRYEQLKHTTQPIW